MKSATIRAWAAIAISLNCHLTTFIRVFHCILDYLDLDDVARLSGANHETHTMCTKYVPMVSEMTLDSLQHRRCPHEESIPSMETPTGYIIYTPISCGSVDKSSVLEGYCARHLTYHICEDCGTVRDVLDETEACADEGGLGCCYKWVCRLEDGGCPPLQCWSCYAYHDVVSMYRYTEGKDLLCDACVQEHGVADRFQPCVVWYGLSLEEAARRRGW